MILRATVSKWTAKYTDEQRQAIEHAHCDVRIRPMAKLVRMAAAGELRSEADGQLVPAFEIPYSSAVSIAKAAERRRAGKTLSPDLAKQPARDRAHALQLRLTALIDTELARLERQQAKRPNSPIDAEQARKIGRALRELATFPDPSEMRLPRTPGQRDVDGDQPDGATKDSLAGKLLAASDASVSPSVRAGTPAHDGRINGSEPVSDTSQAAAAHRDNTTSAEHDNDTERDKDEAPCTAPRERVDGLAASGVVASPAAA